MHAVCAVQLQGFQKQRPLVAERVIHALPPDFHDAHQVIGGCGGKALLRKKAYRLPQRFLLIELFRSRHAPLLFRCSLSDYATYPPSMVRLAPVMNPASSDAREETKLATSDTSPIRFKGISGLTISASAEVISVAVGPG